MEEILIDPSSWILPPYTKCPKCGNDTLGVLSISKDHYLKRCKKCKCDETFILPPISKKVVYIDQMAISNMMKILHPDFREKRLDDVWLKLFEKLYRLSQMQVITCPFSDIHREESSITSYYEGLKKMYQLLGGGIKFRHYFKIEHSQFYNEIVAFLEKLESVCPSKIESRKIALNEDIDGWSSRFFVSIEYKYSEQDIELAIKERDETAKGFEKIFNNWQSSLLKNFEEFLKIEIDTIREIILGNIYVRRMILGEILNKYPDSKQSEKIFEEFILSEHAKSIPYHKISCYLFAGLRRKAASGQKRPPSKGMLNDIRIISSYLPYCDSMFLDNECVALLTENPTGEYIRQFNTQLFSQNSISKFIEYLDNIEKEVSESHKAKVIEVYGENWLKPYYSLYHK